MFFIDLGALTDNEERAQQANFDDLNNFIRADQNITAANERNAGAPGRLAAIDLESQRQVGLANLLQPQIPQINQSEFNTILGRAATRNLSGLVEQGTAALQLPQIPALSQNAANTAQANSQNQTFEAQTLVPQTQQIQANQNANALASQPNQFQIQNNQETLALSLAAGQRQLALMEQQYQTGIQQGRARDLPTEQAIRQQQLQVQSTQTQLNQLNANTQLAQQPTRAAIGTQSLAFQQQQQPLIQSTQALQNRTADFTARANNEFAPDRVYTQQLRNQIDTREVENALKNVDTTLDITNNALKVAHIHNLAELAQAPDEAKAQAEINRINLITQKFSASETAIRQLQALPTQGVTAARAKAQAAPVTEILKDIQMLGPDEYVTLGSGGKWAVMGKGDAPRDLDVLTKDLRSLRATAEKGVEVKYKHFVTTDDRGAVTKTPITEVTTDRALTQQEQIQFGVIDAPEPPNPILQQQTALPDLTPAATPVRRNNVNRLGGSTSAAFEGNPTTDQIRAATRQAALTLGSSWSTLSTEQKKQAIQQALRSL